MDGSDEQGLVREDKKNAPLKDVVGRRRQVIIAAGGALFVLLVLLVVIASSSSTDNVPSDGTDGVVEDAIPTQSENEMKDSLLSKAEEATPDGSDINDYAPRTSPHLEYNQLDCSKRYLLYNPYGGMSNQFMELRNMLIGAQRSKRILYIPMIGIHSNTLISYSELPLSQLFPADRILDFHKLEAFTPVIPLNIKMNKMLVKVMVQCGKGNVDIVVEGRGKDWTGADMYRHTGHSKHVLVHLVVTGSYASFYPQKDMAHIKAQIAFSPFLRELSIKIAHKALGPRFYAIHGRLGDYREEWGSKTSQEWFVNTNQFHHWDKTLPVYLASDEPFNGFFAAIRKRIRVVTYKDLDVKGYLKLFPYAEKMRMDMLGVLDKLICSQAIDFMGSSFSTFTHEIIYIRQHSRYVFPEIYVAKHNQTGAEHSP